eukprot:CAMPEP_0201870210 /NCGR_PEP_ID=MMETSP0902-20130614/3399_1 /ASSEMBLY_ACC=CAM_ASM_000551 /TAXON_ID=420261 /ORGANISM="Thalassiosira antarctica, Strain CCMP982" /LENGTH=416 /DNA_ID=CAMNT_0048395793 /DNA_START=47 /DNA_END=1300 /DNA_ORIENTATION=-
MTKYLCILLAYQAVLIDGFAPTPKQKTSFAATKNVDPRIESAIPAAEIEEGSEELFTGLDGNLGDVGRRQFFVSMVGAASLLALSEDATAFVGTNPLHAQEESMKSGEESLSSTILVSTDDTAATAHPNIDTRDIIGKAAKKALGGGKAGAAAAVLQVLSLMWLRTSMNYQYRFGGTLSSSLKELYNEGGIPRLYQGLPFAIVQGPLTRFGDTAANVGVLALLESIPETAALPLPLKTAAGSITAGLWRIVLMPIDTSKTCMQVEGSDGLERLKQRVIEDGPAPLYQGALASAAATAAGHFPWFLTYNFLNDAIPVISKEDDLLLFIVRAATLGLSASCVSDCVSNSLRVIKTTKQTAGLGDDGIKEISYQEAITLILEKDGVAGLLGRGLQTRLLTNAIQGSLFSVLWKYFQTTL